MMKAKEIILNKLLDKYEKSKSYVKNTNRKIIIKLENIKEYNIEDYETKTIWHDTIKGLKKEKLIDFCWVKFNENNILDKIWLNKEKVDDAYEKIGRINPKRSYILVQSQLEKMDFKQKWIKNFSEDIQKYMQENKKESSLLPVQKSEEIIKALMEFDNMQGHQEPPQILKRVFSIRCFGDSKYFERNIEKDVVKILKKYYLSEEAKISKLNDDEVLTQAGIVKYPEIIEFSGEINCTISGKKVCFCSETLGSYINSNAISKIKDIELPGVEKIIWIENKANYIDYISNKEKNELVIYHGGFYSPIKGEFFKKVYYASKQSSNKNKITYYHWSDIDIGGFMLFTRLKGIVRELISMKMDKDTFLDNKDSWNYFDNRYLKQLEILRDDNRYMEFFDVIDEMLKNKSKLEQEALI